MNIENKCKACEGINIHKIIDLGSLPNPNKLLSEDELDRFHSYPLEFFWCEDCSFFQQLRPVDSKTLFEEDYTYQTGVNAPAVFHFKEVASLISEKVTKKNFAVVLASNDGTEISILNDIAKFKNIVGVEPAKNIARIANSKGYETINAFFGEETGQNIKSKYGKADLVTANNVFAHVPEPDDFLKGIRELLTSDGIAVIEVQWLKAFVEKVAIEMLYAEHMYVWSARAMKTICRRVGLTVVKIDILDNQQGGSLRYWIKLKGRESTEVDLIEKNTGLFDKDIMLQLQIKADGRMECLRNKVAQLRRDKKIIDIWAVPAKVPIILNYSGLNSEDIRVAYDSTPTKIGKYIPKANIKVVDEACLKPGMTDPPDCIIIGAWNYLEYAKSKLSWFTDSGGILLNLLNGEFV